MQLSNLLLVVAVAASACIATSTGAEHKHQRHASKKHAKHTKKGHKKVGAGADPPGTALVGKTCKGSK